MNSINLITFTVLLAALTLPAAAQDELGGRLFTTQAERARLDRLYKENPLQGTGQLPSASVGAPTVPDPEPATLSGFVIRSNGANTTWINQVAHDEDSIKGRVHVAQMPGQKAEISIKTTGGKPVRLKVGDTLDLLTGTVHKIDEQPDGQRAPTDLH